MSHEVETMMFVGREPWHGLGEKMAEADVYDWTIAAKKAGLDWEVELVPLVTKDSGILVDHRAVRRKTDGKVLGVVGPRYVPLQNKNAFEWFQPFLDAKEAQLHTAGSLKGGQRVWVLAKLNKEPMVIAEGDIVDKYILLSHGHDGSLAIRAGFTPVRVVCQNTLAMAHSDSASKLIRIRHSASAEDNLIAVRETMNLANSEFEATAEQYRRLAHRHINQDDVKKYVKKVLKAEEKLDEEGQNSTRLKNIVEDILRRTYMGRGNNLPSIQGTVWQAYQGFTEYLTYGKGSSNDNRLNSLWFGDGANINKYALEVALDMAG